jgi:tryptophan 2,3-dioxygenase
VSVTYASYLRVPQLLDLQGEPLNSDQLLFTVVHQCHELWFKQALAELDAAGDALGSGDLPDATRRVARVTVVFRLLTQHWDTLSTLTPSGYLSFRDQLGSGSGFQSAQFRELEFACGLRDAAYLDTMDLDVPSRARLRERLASPSLADLVRGTLAARGTAVASLLADPAGDPAAFALLEALVDLDEQLATWRSRHVLLVERQIGHKPGTGGSSGVDYLRRTTTKRLFPELWSVRTELG